MTCGHGLGGIADNSPNIGKKILSMDEQQKTHITGNEGATKIQRKVWDDRMKSLVSKRQIVIKNI